VKWEVQVAGANADLDDLCAVFTTDALRLKRRGTGYFLSSLQFEPFADPHQVESRAAELVGLLSGASRLSLGSRSALQVSGVACIESDGHRTVFMSCSDTIDPTARASMEVMHADGTITSILPASAAPAWIAVAGSDPAVAKALRLFGAADESWVDLYRILEVIAQDVGGGEQIVSRGWATRAKIKLFKRTANSVAAVGDDARHGAESTASPDSPMSRGEAKSLVSLILHSWLVQKSEAVARST
jgi:hypothetical protein